MLATLTPRRSRSCRGGENPGTARMFCDISLPDGTPSMADPRHVLQRALAKAGDLGFSFYVHPEIEFFLLKDEPGSGERPVPIDNAGYFDHVPHGTATTSVVRRSPCSSPWASLSSSATTRARRARTRSTSRYADALSMADNIATFRTVVREVALEQGLYATFMPKPFADHPGSGMHTPRLPLRGTATPSMSRGAPTSSQGRSAVHRRDPAPRRRDHGWRDQPVGQQLQTPLGWRRGPGTPDVGPQQPVRHGPRPDVQTEQGQQHSNRGAHARPGVQPLPGLRRDPRGRPQGHRGGLRASPRPGTMSGA